MYERIEISILLDFYGCLLTDKQQSIMASYYNEDLSLGEISELTDTSRQAIHDILKRCNKLLHSYEESLKLVEKERVKVENVKIALELVQSLKNTDDVKNISHKCIEIEKILKIL
jgi:predicted DNA-binding protein YlxM (UPF0122 family)